MKKDDDDDRPLVLTDFDECIIGVACNNGKRAVVYSINRMVDYMITKDGLTYEEATDYLSYNTLGTWSGDGTPVYIYEVTSDAEAMEMVVEMFE
jgi:hypothetical protein